MSFDKILTLGLIYIFLYSVSDIVKSLTYLAIVASPYMFLLWLITHK